MAMKVRRERGNGGNRERDDLLDGRGLVRELLHLDALGVETIPQLFDLALGREDPA
jgi:hypothetical protein